MVNAALGLGWLFFPSWRFNSMPLICSFAWTAQTTGVCTNHLQMEQWWAKPVQLSSTPPHCLEELHLANSPGIGAVTPCHKAFRQLVLAKWPTQALEITSDWFAPGFSVKEIAAPVLAATACKVTLLPFVHVAKLCSGWVSYCLGPQLYQLICGPKESFWRQHGICVPNSVFMATSW